MKFSLISVLLVCIHFSLHAQFGPQQVIDPEVFGITKIVAADINNDGFTDLITSQKYFPNHKISVFPNNGGEGFGEQVILTTDVMMPGGVAAGDLNGNGWIDIVGISLNNNSVYWFPNSEGSFPNEIQLDSTLIMPEDVEIFDVDNDGNLDIVVLDHPNIVVYYNAGGGEFNKVTVPNDEFEYYSFAAADVDGDGFTDLLVGSGEVLVYMNDNGNFTTHDVERTNSIVNHGLIFMIHTADLDGNGSIDLVIDGNSGSEIRWYANDGNGFFNLMQTVETTAQCHSVATGDFDNNGSVDIFASLFQEGEVAWYANEGQGNFGSKQSVSPGIVARTVATAAVDLNNDGATDIVWGHPFSFHLNESTLSADTPALPKSTFTVSPNPFADRVTIRAEAQATLRIYDTTGRCLYENISVEAGYNALNLQLAPKLYLFQFSTVADAVVIKVVKE